MRVLEYEEAQCSCEADLLIRAYRLLDQRMLFYSECTAFSEHVHSFLQAMEIDAVDPSVRFMAFKGTHPAHRTLLICSPEYEFSTMTSMGIASWAVFRSFVTKIITNAQSPYLTLHASAIADASDRAALLVGLGESGKTSLLLGLLSRGLRMVSDEYAPLNKKDGRLHALPTGPTVGAGTLEFFPEIRKLMSDCCSYMQNGARQWTINLTPIYPVSVAYSQLHVSHIYFLRPQFGGESRLETASRDEAYWWLAASVINNQQRLSKRTHITHTESMLRFAAVHRLVEHATLYKVTNGVLQDAVELVAESFGQC